MIQILTTAKGKQVHEQIIRFSLVAQDGHERNKLRFNCMGNWCLQETFQGWFGSQGDSFVNVLDDVHEEVDGNPLIILLMPTTDIFVSFIKLYFVCCCKEIPFLTNMTWYPTQPTYAEFAKNGIYQLRM